MQLNSRSSALHAICGDDGAAQRDMQLDLGALLM